MSLYISDDSDITYNQNNYMTHSEDGKIALDVLFQALHFYFVMSGCTCKTIYWITDFNDIFIPYVKLLFLNAVTPSDFLDQR